MSINIALPAGKYVVAVSGGVDSVVLLNLLARQKDLELIVAHFDHGIRKESASDAKFVQRLANKYGLTFEIQTGKLGKDASEAEARNKRYAFLKTVQQKYQAAAIITAHHQDDVIETSIINILRGTGRRGLSSLKNRNNIFRPLLGFSKAQLISYAVDNKLKWREDKTNQDIKYLRNYVRHIIVPKMLPEQRANWLTILHNAEVINERLDKDLDAFLRRGLHKGQLVLNRQWFTMLPHNLAKEVLINVLVKAGAEDIDKKTVERLVVQIKTLKPGKTIQAVGVYILLTKRSARLKSR